MGKETTCDAAVDGRRGRTTAHLDGSGLSLRGELRARVPVADVRGVVVRNGTLVVRGPQVEIALEVGTAAAAWAAELRDPKTVVAKFGVRRTDRIHVRRIANQSVRDDLKRAVDVPPASALRGTFACIVAQFDTPESLGELEKLAGRLEPGGAIWLVTPKGKGSPVPESMVRAAIARFGLVDVKIAAYDATHTATKAVIPLAKRPAASRG